MPQTQATCPQCRQPVAVEVQQLFDVGQEPQAKQKITLQRCQLYALP